MCKLTEKNQQDLVTLYKQDLTNKEIAGKLGINRRTVYHWIKKLQLTPRQRYKKRSLEKMSILKKSPNIKEVFLLFYNRGYLDIEIANELKVSPQTIARIRNGLNLQPNLR